VRSGFRRAAAFVTSAEDRAMPSRRAIAQDVMVAAIATVAVLVTISRPSGLLTPVRAAYPASGLVVTVPDGSGLGLTDLVLAALTTAPLAVRRVRPLTAFWLIVAAAVLSPRSTANVITLAAVVLAAYSAVVYSRFRGAAILSMPAAGWLDAVYLHNTPSSAVPHTGTAILVLFPVLVAANTIHQWRRQAGDSKARLLRLQADHEAVTRQALKDERARIASELHDVVTHNVSVMIVQAGAARQVLSDAPDDARTALLAVEASGRAAMAELRQLLGLLSPYGPPGAGEEGAGDGQASAGGPLAELQPQPGLHQLGPLIDRVRAAGLPVELDACQIPHDLAPGLGLAAYRIVQEALTNVIKHAGKPATRVSLRCGGGGLLIEVADSGRPIAAAGPAVTTIPGAGRGLVGLRERVALYGGDLAAGPRPGGGWLVTARLPADSRPDSAPGQPGAAAVRETALPARL
jgi:signal transduction histidine kinase